MAADISSTPAADRSWFIVGRWQEYEGEACANLLRIISIGAFYIIELINYHGLHLGILDMPQIRNEAFHRSITALAVSWTLLCLAMLLCLRRQIFPSWLKFASTLADIVLLTGVLMIANGQHSPMVVGYFLVIAVAALRFSLRLIWLATAGSAAGYLFILGYDRWYRPPGVLPLERFEQLIMLVAIVLTGIVLGQMVRRVRGMAEEYSQRMAGRSAAPCSSAQPLELLACADCGATNAATAPKCWLCGRSFATPPAFPAQTRRALPPLKPCRRRCRWALPRSPAATTLNRSEARGRSRSARSSYSSRSSPSAWGWRKWSRAWQSGTQSLSGQPIRLRPSPR